MTTSPDGQDLARGFKPVLCESSLQTGNQFASHLEHHVLPRRSALVAYIPVRSYACTANKADRAVNDDQLAVRAIVKPSQGADAERLIPANLPTSVAKRLEIAVRGRKAADRIDDDSDSNATTCDVHERTQKPVAYRAGMEDERFNVNAVECIVDCR